MANYLANTYYKLVRDGKLNVGYFGGTCDIMQSHKKLAAQNMVAVIDGVTYGPLLCTKKDHSCIHITITKNLDDTKHKVVLKNIDGGKFRLIKLFMA